MIVDDDVDKLVFIHRMPQQVEHVTGDAVMVTPPAVGGIVVPAMLDLAAKRFVFLQLELSTVEVVAPCPRAARVANTGIVEDVLFIGDEGGVEVVIGQAGEIIIVLAGFTAGNSSQVIG